MRVLPLSLILITLFFAVCSFAAVNSGINVDSDVLEAALSKWLADPATPLPAEAVGKRETNAERFRRGLGPLPPPGITHRPFLRPRASSVPCVPLRRAVGTIQVKRASDGRSVGFISKNYDSQASYTITTDARRALRVSLPSRSPFNAPIDITARNGQDRRHPGVGVVGGSSGYRLASGQLGYAYLSGTGHTPVGSRPSSSAGTSMQAVRYNAPSESQIWTLDCTTLTFAATWTNIDGTRPTTTTIYYDPAVNYLGITGDLAVFNSAFREGAFAVTFSYVPG